MSIFFNQFKIDEEYYPMINDLIKYSVIFIVVNFLMYFSNSKSNKLLSESYIKFMTFVLLGVMTYWLVIKRIFVFE